MASQSDKALGLYNMTSGVGVTIEEQAKVIIELFGGESKSKIVYRPEKSNNTPSYLYSMDKAYRDFGFKPSFVSFKDMMVDYKMELESGRWNDLINRED